MSSHTNDEHQRMVNKLLKERPEISLDLPMQNTIASNTIPKPNAFSNLSISNQDSKQCGNSKLPPYVNSSRLPARTNKNVLTNQPIKSVSPKPTVSEKSVPSAMSDSSLNTARLLSNSKDVCVEVTRQRSSNQIPCLSIDDSKSTSESIDDDDFQSPKSKQFQDQISRPNSSQIFEKNISNNIISLTQRVFSKSTLSTIPIPTPYSDVGKSITHSVPPSITPFVKNHSPCKDTVVGRADQITSSLPAKIESMPTNSVKEDSTKKLSKIDSNTVEILKKSISISMDTSEVAEKIGLDPSKNSVPQVIYSERAKEFLAATKNTDTTVPKVLRTPTTSIKTTDGIKLKPATFSVGNVSSSQSVQTVADSTQTASSNNRAKEAMEALNAGDNYALTNSVTISNPSAAQTVSICSELLTVLSSGDSKFKNICSETNVTSVTKVVGNHSPLFGSNGDGSGDSGNSSRNNAVHSPSSVCPSMVSSSSSAPTSTSPTSSPSLNFEDAKTQKMRFRKEIQNSNLQLGIVHSTDSEEENVRKEDNLSKKVDETVECLTISSDDDEDPNEIVEDSYVSSALEEDTTSISLLDKEPLIEDDDETTGNSDMENVDCMLDDVDDKDSQLIGCRSARIGSYKSQPIGPVILSKYGVRIEVPPLNDDTRSVILKIPIKDIKKILVNFGEKFPVIFYYVSAQCGVRIRNLLNMSDANECYFDPTSKDESVKRITLLPDDSSKLEADRLKSLYSYPDRKLMAVLDTSEANELLLKSLPKEIRRSIQRPMKPVPHNKVQTIMVFPPPPAKGGISINTEDYACLEEDVFLNDVIIDFYLKYLYLNILKDEEREKTHIFSSFFYKRLTDKATPIPKNLHGSKTGDSTITAAEIRHSRVKNWTKNIDLFKKDFIIIPLNENQHWFLAIICYPGLRGPVSFNTNEPVQMPLTVSSENKTKVGVEIDEKHETMTIGSTTITPIKAESSSKYATLDEDGDGEDRDEADGADEEEHLNVDSEDDTDEHSDTSTNDINPRLKPKREPIKQPCILIFDSLAGASRARIIATLREYLSVEYKVKHGEERDFSKNVVKGNCPKVPQQNNFTDCGLFVLQYVESFFENKITDYNLPIKMLSEWFEPDKVGTKRFDIQQLLLKLMRLQGIAIEELSLPKLALTPNHSDDSNDDYYEDVDYDDDEDMDGYGPSEDEYDDEDEDDEMGENDYHGMHYRVPIDHDSEDDEECDGDDKVPWFDEDTYGTINDDESIEDDDELDIYENMDDIETVSRGRSRSTSTSATHRELKREFDESRQNRVELDIDTGNESDNVDVEIQERLFGSNDDVTILVASGSRTTGGDGSDTLDPIIVTTTMDRKHRLEELKAARPFNNRDSSENGSGCSSSKKFKSD